MMTARKPRDLTSDTERVLEVYQQTKSIRGTADALGMKYDAVQKRIKRSGVEPVLPVRGQTSTLVDKDGNTIVQWIKGGKEALSAEEAAKTILDVLKGYKPPAALKTAPRGKCDKDLFTLVPLADLHLGLLAWHRETGTDWDLSIALKTLLPVIDSLISVLPVCSEITILGLGDLLHADNYLNRTSRAGNALDVDGRYPKILEAATKLILHCADRCAGRANKVRIRILPGNHDDVSSIAVSHALALRYENSKNISVDTDYGRYWYYQWGECLLGATHGDQAKMRDFPGICATQVPKLWGATKHRALFTGHIHQQSSIEKHGAIVESLQSPTAPDAWTVGMGYGGGRSMQAITYHKTKGEVMRNRVNLK